MTIRRLPTNELYHHGVKGQKWGVRRYQNPDGTLTPAGMKKYYTTNKYLSLRDRENYAAEKGGRAGGRVMLAGAGIATAGIVGRKVIGNKIKQTLNEDSKASTAKLELARLGVKHGARIAALGAFILSTDVYMNKRMKTMDETLKMLTPEQKERLKKLEILDEKLSEIGDADDEIYINKKYPYKKYNALVKQKQKIYDEDERFASGSNNINKKMHKESKVNKPKENKLTVADIDDEELIDLYIDEPDFRKEYNISNADYQRYKKTGKF